MRMKPLLAIAALAVTLAGCSATLRFGWENYETRAFETVEALDVDYELYYDIVKTHRLELDLSLTTQDDKPLLGIHQENLDLRRFEVTPYSWSGDDFQTDLAPRGNGNYTLGIDFRHSEVPASVDVALTLRNTPMIRDVEY